MQWPSRSERAQWFAIVLVLAIFGLFLGLFIHHERTLTLERERDRLLTQIRVIDANLTQQLEGVNAAMLSLRPPAAISSVDTKGNAQRSTTLRVLADAMPTVRTMLMMDAQGIVRSASRPDALGFDASQRGYFLTAKTPSSADTLHVIAPFTTALNVYALTLVRAWTDDQHQLTGVTMAALDPEYFTVLLRSVLYADDMRATLIHGDGLAFLTVPVNPAIQGANLKQPGSLFAQHLAAGRTESFSVTDVAITGDQRMLAFRTMQPAKLHMDKPLLLAVSRELSAVLAPWRQLALLLSATYGVMCILILGGIFLWRRKQKALRELTQARAQDAREQAERLDLALSGGNLGLFDQDMVSGIRHVNARVREMVGDGPDDPVDTMAEWAERRHPDDRASSRATLMAHAQGETEALTMDYRIKHKDGRWVWIHSRGRVTARDADGRALRMVGTYQDISDRKAAEALIAEFAFYDPLTKLPNRRLLMDRLSQAQVVSARSGKHAALLFMDLDRFKWINDTLGHDMGDVLLQQVALRLQACVRQSDTVARMGGDEFVLVLDQLGDSVDEARVHAVRMAEKILSALREPVQLGAQAQVITSSVGITVFSGETESAAQLLKYADEALYQAKADGRDQAVVHATPKGDSAIKTKPA